MGEAARASIRSLEAAGLPVALNNVAVAPAHTRCQLPRGIRRRQPAPVQPRSPERRQHAGVRRGARPALFPRSLHDRLLVLGAVDAPRRLGALCRLRRRGVDGHPVRAGRRAAAARCRSARCPSRSCCRRSRRSAARTSACPKGRGCSCTSSMCRARPSARIRSAAIRAFRRAGLPHDDAVLVLKFTNPEYDRAGVRRLHEEAAGLTSSFSTLISIGRSSARWSTPLTAICRRTAPKDSA